MSIETGHPADDGPVFGEVPIAVQLGELGERTAQVVECVRPPRMAREPGDLPGRELGEDRARQRLALRAEPVDLLADVDARIAVDVAKLLDLCFEIGDRTFEVEGIHAHLRIRGRFGASRGGAHDDRRYPRGWLVTTCIGITCIRIGPSSNGGAKALLQYSIRTRSTPATSWSRARRSSVGRTAHASPSASLACASRRR